MKKWIVLLLLAGCAHTSDSSKDPYLWLEDVEGKEALEWVKAQNEQTLQNLAQSPEFKKVEEQTLQILEAKDKIPAVSFIGSRKLLNFWRDDKSVRGVLRVTSYDNYKKKSVPWDVVLDLDRVAAEEKENWIFKGIDCVAPQFEQCFVLLSRGGKDAVVLREYNIKTKQFNAKGFSLPESKMYVTWADKDHLLVGTDYGPGTMTESGYPRIVKLWKRGTPLDSAKMIYEGAMTDVWARPIAVDQGKKRVLLVSRGIDFFNTEDFVVDVKAATYKKIPKPNDAEFEGYFADQFLYSVKSPWNIAGTTYNSGDVIGLKEAVAGKEVGPQDILKIFTPTPNQSVTSISVNKSKIILSVLEDVKGKLFTTTYSNNQWQPVIPMQFPGTGSLNAITDTETDIILVNYESFNQPSTLYGIDYGKKAEVLKTLPDRFDAKDVVVEQKFSTSKDGTKIPYFLIRKSSVALNGEAPTLLYGYGGFTVSQAPAYNGVVGKLWLERGGVYVVANIRGGGEYGPKWHQAALKENRQKAYDDFISVAEDLIQTKVTSPRHLAIRGGSNGGLLVGAVMTQRPELFGAVLCWVPLLDMMRYSQLLAGASWMGEYGDPKVPTYRRAILKYSPYQNVGNHKNYPPTLIVTSTKDDRVHPGHARKMMAKMKDMKQPVMYYENIEGGHAAGANFKQVARLTALQQMFLEQTVLKK